MKCWYCGKEKTEGSMVGVGVDKKTGKIHEEWMCEDCKKVQ